MSVEHSRRPRAESVRLWLIRNRTAQYWQNRASIEAILDAVTALTDPDSPTTVTIEVDEPATITLTFDGTTYSYDIALKRFQKKDRQ